MPLSVQPVPAPYVVVCLSHLRWSSVFQRPQHLMTRFARDHRVLFWEEPEFDWHGTDPVLRTRTCGQSGVTVLTPVLPSALPEDDRPAALATLLDTALGDTTGPVVRWYYTPMMLPFSRHVAAACVVYDCMDELSGFLGAPPELLSLESELLGEADMVFTGGHSLYEAKRHRHANIHPFPSSVDVAHFAQARRSGPEPTDQAALPGPRLGYYGVIDERLDLGLVAALADQRPDWSIVMVGPVVKISEDDLPRRANIHWLGGKDYAELPDYLRGWDVALMPFALNEATRFISPTKTPEYLAAGRPVVSTPIADVVRHYGEVEAVRIADGADAFVAACDDALALVRDGGGWLAESDALLADQSWDRTFTGMAAHIAAVLARRPESAAREHYDVLVVGAGFAGAVMAERLAADGGKRVLVIDRRSHIAGNAFDHHDAAGVLMHQYGPHIFHTNSDDVFAYLSRFTDWRPYEHRVLAEVDGRLVPMPINRTTLNALYDLDMTTEAEVDDFLAARAEPVEVVRTSADVVVSKIGRELYETFFQGYTRKQWGLDPSELDKSVTARVPTRSNDDDRYFTDIHQAMPLHGFTAMFERMLDHPNITVRTGVDFDEVRDAVDYDHLVFTGPIDEYFGWCYGRLPYRSLRFEHRTFDLERLQAVAVVNHPAEHVPHTRVTEYKHLTGQVCPRTTVTFEVPSAEGDPYYPIPRPENQALYKRYQALALMQADVTFVGRLATYRYYNMDQVVGQALAAYRRLDTANALTSAAGGAKEDEPGSARLSAAAA